MRLRFYNKTMCFLLLVASGLSALYSVSEERGFVEWMRETGNLFTASEYHLRLGVYLANARFVSCHNRKSGFRVSLNKFAAMTPAEYRTLLSRKPSRPSNKPTVTITKAAPESKDWRDDGVVNAVKDQGQCGSCWAFGTIQACESAYAIKHGTLLSCSEQNLVDCAHGWCSGCDGGLESDAFEYIIHGQGGFLNLESDYPYTAVEGPYCKFDYSKGVNQIASYQNGKYDDEENLRDIVGTIGVADVAIDASAWSFQLYTGGIYDEPSCSSSALNHAVGCVGYGAENGVDYWIIRNSWGPNWGENGYIRMSRNKHNQCGVAADPLIPTAA